MATTPATGAIVAIADMATSIIGMIQTYENLHNSPGMLQAAIAGQWAAQKDTAEKAVAAGDAQAVEKAISE